VLGIGPQALLSEDKLQAQLDYRFDLIDPLALFSLARVLDYGAKKYGENNWRKIALREHINRVISHAYAALAELNGTDLGEDHDNHIDHMFTRAMFACATANGSFLTPEMNFSELEMHAAATSINKKLFSPLYNGLHDWQCYVCDKWFNLNCAHHSNGAIHICEECFDAVQ
jgi:hypothetical protein